MYAYVYIYMYIGLNPNAVMARTETVSRPTT